MDAQLPENGAELHSVVNSPSPPASPAKPARSSASFFRRIMNPLYAMPTGRKLFIAILFALSPLALITLFANIQSARAGDADRKALLTATNQDLAQRIASTIVTDENLVRRPLAALGADIRTSGGTLSGGSGGAPNTLARTADDYRAFCQDIYAALRASKDAAPELHLLRASDSTHLCHDNISKSDEFLNDLLKNVGRLTVSTELQALVDVVPITDHNGTKLVAMLVYPLAMLQQTATPTTRLPPYDLYLTHGEEQLELNQQLGVWAPGNTLSVTTPIGRTGTSLEMSAYRKSLSQSDLVSFLAPIGMWLLAGGLAWVLVNQLMLKPLREIQRTVSLYRPGQLYRPQPRAAGTAIEISTLERDMAALSAMVAQDKQALAKGLEHQTLLTREVHHRVKNNLQIIASLLNIHSRSADAPAAADAYRSIQRRVDALSAVHRNHFAELEDNEGIALRPLLSELAAGLRGTSPLDTGVSVAVHAMPVQIEQDVAVPIAFLLTEIGELALLTDPQRSLTFSVERLAEDKLAELTVQSDSLKASERLSTLLETRFGRILTGLSRQLRQPLRHDDQAGRYQILFPTLD